MPHPNRVYVLVDSESVNSTLRSILGSGPASDQRPRLYRIREFAEEVFEKPARCLYFFNVSSSYPVRLVQALRRAAFTAIPVAPNGEDKEAHIAVERTLASLREREGDVLLLTHDSCYIDSLEQLDDGRRIGVLGFKEFFPAVFSRLDGLELFDLEHDALAFDSGRLPRALPTRAEAFDPEACLTELEAN